MSTVTKHTPGTICWLDLMTPDLEKARSFYGELFGWKYEIGSAETGYYTMCKLGDRNAAGMGQKPKDAPFPSAWNLYFAVEDIDATCAQIKEHGGQVGMGPIDVMGEGRLAVCSDPTGAHFGLWQPMRHPGANVVDEPGAMTWHEVNTRDAQRAGGFYAAVFGLETRKMEGMSYWTLHKGEKVVGGVLQMDEKWPQDIPPHWMSYFAVRNTDDAVKKIQALGGETRFGPFDTPYGRMAVVADPLGAVFTVIVPSQLAQQM